MKKRTFKIIAAIDRNRGIGYQNQLPWPRIKEDMQYFKKITTETSDPNKINVMIMGRKTYESLKKELPSRINIVISSTYQPGINTFKTLNEALLAYYEIPEVENIFVIGGQQLFTEAIQRLDCETIYLTQINENYQCDRFFPSIPAWFFKSPCKQGENVEFEVYQNRADPQSDEQQYLSLLREIINTGENKDGRNGKTISIFGPQHVFDLQQGFPLLTTKRMFFDGIVKELLFFLRGQTDANILSAQGVNIWNGNSSREFLDKRGLVHYQVGDIGPMYGYNFRHFGHSYEGCQSDYTGKGYDQLFHLLDSLIKDPHSRRHLLTTYNPATVAESVLAPCHGISVQFNVRTNGELDCKMFQRSVDAALGYPFNIASYALLVHILCQVTGYKPGKLIMTLGDTHLYNDHIEKIKKQLDRVPLVKPKLEIKKEFQGSTIEERIKFIEELTPNDIQLSEYYHWPGIKLEIVI